MSEETKDFIIKDKRASAKEKQSSETEGPSGDTAAQREAAQAAEDASRDLPFPKIDFATFIISLNHSVLFHLGLIEDPGTGKKSKNLSMAKQTIDILGMLEEKTRGNLTSDEESMLKNILYDLRILYVKEKG
jgi:hypothetical protein